MRHADEASRAPPTTDPVALGSASPTTPTTQRPRGGTRLRRSLATALAAAELDAKETRRALALRTRRAPIHRRALADAAERRRTPLRRRRRRRAARRRRRHRRHARNSPRRRDDEPTRATGRRRGARANPRRGARGDERARRGDIVGENFGARGDGSFASLDERSVARRRLARGDRGSGGTPTRNVGAAGRASSGTREGGRARDGRSARVGVRGRESRRRRRRRKSRRGRVRGDARGREGFHGPGAEVGVRGKRGADAAGGGVDRVDDERRRTIL